MDLEALLDRKGALSSQIGQAKKKGESIDSLLQEMRSVSAQIKDIKAKHKKEKQEASKDIERVTGDKSGKSSDQSTPAIFNNFDTDKAEAKEETLSAHANVSIQELSVEYECQWEEYVAGKPNSAIYHQLEFRNVITKSFQHEVIYLIALNDAGSVVGVLPSTLMRSKLFGQFIVSLPFFSYGGAIADSSDVEKKLCDHLCELAKSQGLDHVEIRAQTERSILSEHYDCKQHKISMVRALPESEDQLWNDIGTKVRAQIKKAQRFDFRCRFGGAELVDDFYDVFARNMRDLGTPVYAKSFFSTLMKSAISDQFQIGVVYLQSKPVACCFLMRHRDVVEIPWASAISTYNHMNLNMFMYWEILKKSVAEGADFFDFGRSSKDASTYRFKKQWGAKPVQLFWYYWMPEGESMPELNPNNPKYKLLIAVWQKLPVWISKLIGPMVVKYLP